MKGIQGLTPLLEQVQKPIEISVYAGKRVAVDGHDWLHAAAFPFASEFARGIKPHDYITCFMNLVKMLQSQKVVPIVVFASRPLPLKKALDENQAKQRKILLDKGHALYEKGKLSEANKCFQKAFTVTHAMIARIIEELDRYKVQHIVAPFEAEAQLAYLSDLRQAKAVISKNPQLLAFGVTNVIFEIDQQGHGQQVALHDLLDLMKLDLLQLRYLCILSGTEFLPSLRGIGFKTAQEIVRKERTLDKILKMVQDKYPKCVAEPYTERFAYLHEAYMYQFVINIHRRTYERLNDLPNYAIKDLGKRPQETDDVPLLKSNNAYFIDFEQLWKDADKENRPYTRPRVSEFVDVKKKSSVILKGTKKPLQPICNNWISHPPAVVKLTLPLPSYTPPLCASESQAKRKNTFKKCNLIKARRL